MNRSYPDVDPDDTPVPVYSAAAVVMDETGLGSVAAFCLAAGTMLGALTGVILGPVAAMAVAGIAAGVIIFLTVTGPHGIVDWSVADR